MQLRPYQIESFDAIIKWVKKSFDPCIVSLSTGAGKSLIIAAVAEALHSISGGKKYYVLRRRKN